MNPIVSRPVMVFLVLSACCAALAPAVIAAACDHPVDPIVLGSCQKDTTASESQVVLRCADSSTSIASQPIDEYSWNFGEASGRWVAFGENKNAMYEYAGGEVLIYHSVQTICSRFNKSIIRTTFFCNSPAAGFTVDKESGTAPLTVHITDKSQHTPADITTWQYRKDNVQFSTQRNPTLTFSSPGTYTITQLVKKTCSPVSDAASKTIKVSPAIAVYSAVNLSGVTISSPTTTVTTTVTTTTTAAPASVVPSYSDTPFAGAAPAAATMVQAPVETITAPQQTTAAWSSPAPSQAPQTSVSQTPGTTTPGTGTLSVKTDPAGAKIFVDDVMRGMSPASIPELAAGPHTLRLEKAGYQNMTVPVSIGDGRVTEYSTSLEAESGGLGIVPIIVGVLVIAAFAGGAYWYTRKKSPGTGGQV